MHPADCPVWEYSDDSRRHHVLVTEIEKVLVELRRKKLATDNIADDSRAVHTRIFTGLTPPGYSYFAGHFRGEDFRCLKFYAVGIQNDPRVGLPPQMIETTINALIARVHKALAEIDSLKDPLAQFTHAIRLACSLFETFLRTHPYANGNGHIARLSVWAVLGRYDRWPEDWPVEPRPPDPPYTELILQYRNGNHAPLEEFMIKTVLGWSASAWPLS